MFVDAEERTGADRDVVGPAEYFHRVDAFMGEQAGYIRVRRTVLRAFFAGD
jgi:hypothetical protein